MTNEAVEPKVTKPIEEPQKSEVTEPTIGTSVEEPKEAKPAAFLFEPGQHVWIAIWEIVDPESCPDCQGKGTILSDRGTEITCSQCWGGGRVKTMKRVVTKAKVEARTEDATKLYYHMSSVNKRFEGNVCREWTLVFGERAEASAFLDKKDSHKTECLMDKFKQIGFLDHVQRAQGLLSDHDIAALASRVTGELSNV